MRKKFGKGREAKVQVWKGESSGSRIGKVWEREF